MCVMLLHIYLSFSHLLIPNFELLITSFSSYMWLVLLKNQNLKTFLKVPHNYSNITYLNDLFHFCHFNVCL